MRGGNIVNWQTNNDDVLVVWDNYGEIIWQFICCLELNGCSLLLTPID